MDLCGETVFSELAARGDERRTRNVEVAVHVIANDTVVKDERPFVGTHLEVVSDR